MSTLNNQLPTTEPGSSIDNPKKVIVAGATGSEALKVGSMNPSPGLRQNPAKAVLAAFLPNRVVSRGVMQMIVVVEALLALALWINSPFKVLPRPGEVFHALQQLWLHEGLGQELATSFRLNLEALAWSSAICLLLAYLTVIPVFRPIVAALSKGRFLSMVGFTFIFTLIWGGGHPLKLSLLVFAISVFYLTGLAAVVAAIPRQDFDYARTLRMREWRVVWEVVVLGTADKALEVLRQNAAMGWMMLTMVEGIVRSEGGIGTMLLNENKHFLLANVFAIQIVILLVGLIQDYAIGGIRRLLCPYADLTLERR